MSGETWIKFYPSDWLSGTFILSPAERGVYITLLALIYDELGPIKDDRKLLARQCNMRVDQFTKALESLVAMGKLDIQKGTITNAKSVVIIAELKSRREKSSKGGLAKAGKITQQNQYEEPAQADIKQDLSTEQAMPEVCQDAAIPDTRYQIPERKRERESARAQEGQSDHVREIDQILTANTAALDQWEREFLLSIRPRSKLTKSQTESLNGIKSKIQTKATQEPAKAPAASVWVWKDSPQWQAWSANRKWPTKDARHPSGGMRPGWFFPAEWPAPPQKPGQGGFSTGDPNHTTGPPQEAA